MRFFHENQFLIFIICCCNSQKSIFSTLSFELKGEVKSLLLSVENFYTLLFSVTISIFLLIIPYHLFIKFTKSLENKNYRKFYLLAKCREYKYHLSKINIASYFKEKNFIFKVYLFKTGSITKNFFIRFIKFLKNFFDQQLIYDG